MAPKIIIDNSTYYQTKRVKRVNLNVGTRATLLPRQPVKVKCLVKNFDKKLIFWTRNNRLISMLPSNRVHVNHNGILKIRRTDPYLDSGTFTCIAGLARGSIYLSFQNKKHAKKAAMKMMKNMIEESEINTLINKPQSDKVPGVQGPILPIQAAEHFHSKHSIKTRFITSDWSECSTSCGAGIQTRKVECSIINTGFIKIVDDIKCIKDNTYKPLTFRKCNANKNCPRWSAGPWGMVRSLQFFYDIRFPSYSS